MNFPDFNDFIAEFANEENDDIELCNPIIQIKTDENGNIKLSTLPDIVKTVTIRCEQFSLMALRRYHEWLSEHLSDNQEN